MGRQIRQKKIYYFSEKLKKQLDRIQFHPLTIVEAPSGFGKTTAIKEYLKTGPAPEARAYWYTCLGEPTSMAWRGLCELLGNVNREIAANLRELEMPTIETLLHMATILRKFQCESEVYLVVDNYHLMNSDIPREILSVFSMHGSPNLHMIFITQQLANKQQLMIQNAEILAIHASAFLFDREGTACLFRMEGIRLTDEDVESVYMSTEGWVSAIRLQILNFEQTGKFDQMADIEQLVEAAIWQRLLPEEKEFLLSVSVMDSFTARQAAIVIKEDELPESIEELLKYSDFIHYFPDKGTYAIHSILQDYLRNRFYHHQTLEFQKEILRAAGLSYIAASQYYAASQLFLRVGDFDAILSMPFDSAYLSHQREKDMSAYIEELVLECPRDILCKYPHTMLIFAYPMLFDRRMEAYRKLTRAIESVIVENPAGLSGQALRQTGGEYALLKSFAVSDDLRQMHQERTRALECMGGPSGIVHGEMPWEFGGNIFFHLFWREPGRLSESIDEFGASLPLYLKLTRGHGAGSADVMRAEALLLCGEDDEAEVLCYKSLYEARSFSQAATCLSAESVLARIAVLRGNAEGYFTAVKNIQAIAQEHPDGHMHRMAEFSLSMLSLLLGTTDNIVEWLRNMQSIQRIFYAATVPYVQVLYAMHLMIEKRYNELLGVSQILVDTAQSTSHLMPRVYGLKYLAMVRLAGGHKTEARAFLKEALDIALPDRVYLPFVQNLSPHDGFARLLEGASPDRTGVRAVMGLLERQDQGVRALQKALLHEKSPLTPREREIAQLAKERLSAKEIACRLYISDATVRTILRNVYSKLDVHSKAELNDKKF